MLLDEFYPSAFRRKLYRSIAELLRDLDAWIAGFSEGTKRDAGATEKPPMETFFDTLPVA